MSAAEVFNVATIIWNAKGCSFGKAIIPEDDLETLAEDEEDLVVNFVL